MSDHRAGIVGVAFLADNKSVVSAGADNALRVWTPAAVRIFAGHDGPILCLAVLPNGAQICTGSADKSIKFFDVGSGNVVRTLAGHTAAVRALAVSKDGSKVVSGSADKTFRVWNVADGSPLLAPPACTAEVAAVAVAGNNLLAAAGLTDGTVKLYDLAVADATKADRASFKGTDARRVGDRFSTRFHRAAGGIGRQGRLTLGDSHAGRREDLGGPFRSGLWRGLEP